MFRDVIGRCTRLGMLFMMFGWPQVALAQTPQLTVVGDHFVDPQGHTVILRGVSSMGMSMVYGDKANPGTYLPMTPAQYVDRAVQTDATGNKWYSTAIRLVFERFPSVNPTRLYTVENQPYAMPDTVAFAPWQGSHAYVDGDVVSSSGSRYRVMSKLWRADRGQPWNPTPYRVNELIVNVQGNVYKCTSSTGSGVPTGNWGLYPQGTGQAIPENQGALQYVWQYVGPFGQSGTAAPFSGSPVVDNNQSFFVDNLVQWQYMSVDYTPAQALANFTDWKSKVMDPVVQRAITDGLYVIITDFDFGPAHHPLRHARMLDFWTRMAASQWANHPQVLFELWNESEDIGTYSGGPGSWSAQKPAIQETVNAIRAAGANNIIVVPPPFYSSRIGEATADPLTGTNIAYALHQYRSQYEAYSSNRDQITQGLASGKAIVVTEWGDDTSETNPALMWPTNTSVPPTFKQLLEPSDGAAHPAAGTFAWSLSQTWGPDLFANTALTTPTPFGVATRQWLLDKRFDSQPSTTATGGAPASPTGLRLLTPPNGAVATGGTPQSTLINTAYSTALKATVRDVSSNPLAGIVVTFTAPASGARATFASGTTATAVTDASGVATAPALTANATAGAFTVSAAVSGVPAAAIFSLTNTNTSGAGGTATSIAASAGTPQTTTVNTNFASTLQVLVKDSANNPVSGAVVTFTAPAGAASARFAGATTVTSTTNSSGLANSPTPTATGAAGGYTVSATVTGVATGASFSLTNTSGGGSGGAVGTWVSVTPGNVNLTATLDCSNFGTITVVADPLRPSNLYTHFDCQGIWKSTDYGQTWTGPINTGSGGQGAKGAGGIAIAPGPAGQPPILYSAGIRGSGTGFWKSLDGGVSWTQYNVAPGGARQDYYPPVVDPYNPNHIVMNGHEMNLIVQSFDGGQTWSNVPMNPGMNENGGTGGLAFVNTGNPATTANTWLWLAQANGGNIGTWRTANAGASWTRVDNNEHPHGASQFYQPDTSGVIYMAGVYSAKGWGVLRSADYGQTWVHVGNTSSEAVVFGTPNKVYAMWSWACGNCTVDTASESAPAPGITGWVNTPTPAGMAIGAAQTAIVFDGSHYVIVGANWNSGLWRYVEP